MPEQKSPSDRLQRTESGHNLPPTSLSMVSLQQNAQRVGFLLKHEKGFFKSLFGRSWKRKYCILSGYHFYFFKNKKGAGKDGGSNGVINLRYFDQCTLPTEKQCSLPHVFRLSSSQKSDNYSFLFQADSVDEMQRWMTDIQLVIFQCQTQGRTSAGPQAASRQGSQPGSPLAARQLDPAVHDHHNRHSSIPESGSAGVYRTTSSGDERDGGDYDNQEHEPASRSESRNAKPVEMLVPRMPKYNQVVSELQLKLHRPDPSDTSPTPHKPASRHPSSVPPVSPRPDSSTSSSGSSYPPHTPPGHVIEPPAPFRLPPLPATPGLKSPHNLDAQFDSVLQMMEHLQTEVEEEHVNGVAYAVPYKKDQRPAVPPKPKRELYENLLANHVTLQVSPVVGVTG
ncbi:PH and SEC7 domain-containing protein 1-like [Paramacrobiotus metropolitanus]|uniref:PH and SEC7 domain-containing protein 1-like n=1 Tax=Paramacrobiotus metropolitanus TaxID=2943436 RepID=UPI00244560A5|nr:PH and SEC7 domain-containing protein 1-like [Paramacrobiotus metropolitanus]